MLTKPLDFRFRTCYSTYTVRTIDFQYIWRWTARAIPCGNAGGKVEQYAKSKEYLGNPHAGWQICHQT